MWSHLSPVPGLLEVTSGGSGLHIEPEDAELVLRLHSTFSLVCYGDGTLVWERDGQPLTAVLEHRDGVFISNLTLRNVTGRHTGEYACFYSPDQAPERAERKALYVYVPGKGQHILTSAWKGPRVAHWSKQWGRSRCNQCASLSYRSLLSFSPRNHF